MVRQLRLILQAQLHIFRPTYVGLISDATFVRTNVILCHVIAVCAICIQSANAFTANIGHHAKFYGSVVVRESLTYAVKVTVGTCML